VQLQLEREEQHLQPEQLALEVLDPGKLRFRVIVDLGLELAQFVDDDPELVLLGLRLVRGGRAEASAVLASQRTDGAFDALLQLS
jgi:hypothetical protein